MFQSRLQNGVGSGVAGRSRLAQGGSAIASGQNAAQTAPPVSNSKCRLLPQMARDKRSKATRLPFSIKGLKQMRQLLVTVLELK